MPSPVPLEGTLLFHLNLSYSAIEVAEREEVVRRCYRPLLELARALPWLTVAIEASGHTLERIAELDPEWIDQLRELVADGGVEFVGSGDSQVIGPLVPSAVNRWNQRLGRETYARILEDAPSVALVNEMAWSQGIVDAYVEAGYSTLVMEWNNPRRSHPEWSEEWRYGVVRTASPTGREIDVVWADAVAFQKLQRAVSGDVTIDEYVAWILGRRGERARHLFLYANDAEIFDFRPGRYDAEPALRDGEWVRMRTILERLHAEGVAFTSPARVAADPRYRTGARVVLNSASDPIPVKKQPKYNASRWALTGHDDVGINARCFARARALAAADPGVADPADPARDDDADAWRALCRAWASDLRTHLTASRWEEYVAGERATPDVPDPTGEPVHRELSHTAVVRGERRLVIETDDVTLTLLPRRGLAIEALAFPSVSDEPLCGTLPHGHFDGIDWAADFYTGHAVLDIPARRRVTDLGPSEPRIRVLDDRIEVEASIATPLGTLHKTVTAFADSVGLRYGFSAWGERIPCTLRAGHVTLLPNGLGERIWVECANGGPSERFELADDFDHGASVSPLVSAGAAFGATEGRIALGDEEAVLELEWPNWRVAALPLMTSRRVGDRRFVRLALSLAEIDETHRPGARLVDFDLTLRGRRTAA